MNIILSSVDDMVQGGFTTDDQMITILVIDYGVTCDGKLKIYYESIT